MMTTADQHSDALDGLTLLLGPRQAQIMRLFWAFGTATAREIHTQLAQNTPLAYTTVTTICARLAELGLLLQQRVTEPDGRIRYPPTNRYTPLMSEAAFVRSAVVFPFSVVDNSASLPADLTPSAILPILWKHVRLGYNHALRSPMTTDSNGLVLLLLLLLAWRIWMWWRQRNHNRPAVAAQIQRLLKPRTPNDCPSCCQQAAAPVETAPPNLSVPPWRDRKSRRGAPKRIATHGFACPHRACPYYQITDAQIHALVGDGMHGKIERIQTFRCQACQTTFSARRNTPLYRLKTPSHRVAEVLAALAEGLDVAAAVRVFGHRPATITVWLRRAGEHSATLHERWFHQLRLPHIQLDEIRTRLRSRAYTLWLWLAVDPLTKIIPVLHLGARTQAAAHATVHALYQRLAPGCIPVFTSDGLNLYFYALTAHFGQWVATVGRRTRQWQLAAGLIYGQVKKTYRRRKLVRVTQLMRCGTRVELSAALKQLGLSGQINTAFIERLNLTVRQSVAALVRRTWSTAQEAPQLLTHLHWWQAYYHFVRPHEALRVVLAQPIDRGGKRVPQRYRQRTPAMAAGLTLRRWSVREVLTLPLAPTPIGAG